MSIPPGNEPQQEGSMNESEALRERDSWADDHSEAIRFRCLPSERPLWREGAEEPLSIAAVFYALMAIRQGKSRARKPGGKLFDPANWEEVNRPPEDAIRIITRALQAGAKGEKLIKKALELKPRAKGAILARHIASELTKPEGGWPNKDEDGDRFNSETVEWVKPTKGEVERELARHYPEIYDNLPMKDGNGGKVLRSEFWEDAGLKDAIDQTRGYK
jgi:hypothetical protein